MKIGRLNDHPFVLDSDTTGHVITNFTSLTALLQEPPATWQAGPTQPFTTADLQAPIPQPGQVFAIGMNYADHSKEIHLDLPKTPSIFTKFPSSITGPTPTVQHHGTKTDWETELVVVIGTGGRNISEAAAPAHIAGYMVGEDLSDRAVQFANDPAQFSLGKSFENYAPIGPWLTTPADVGDLAQFEITTTVNGSVMQHAPLSQMVFDVPTLVAYLSTIVELRPGDLIFTGTPEGTGTGHDPQRFLQAGDHLTGTITGLGELAITIS